MDKTTTSYDWLANWLRLNDTFYPTGSYAHSFGLEGLVAEGVVHDRETLRTFLFVSVLPALRHTELSLAACAWRAFGDADWSRVGELCVLSSALKTAREARTASENIGRQRAELAASLQNSELASEFLRRAADAAWPMSASISAALEGRVHGAPIDAVLASVFYSTVSATLAAAMKLLRLGQMGCQSLMSELMFSAPDAIASSQQVEIKDIGWFNPWLDIAAARHETADARLFIS